jgi:Lysylphosphatidylglycerol synthase TM region
MTKSRILQLGNLGFWVLVVAAGIRYVVPRWREFQLSSRLSTLDTAWVIGAILVLLLQYLAVFALWRRVLHVLGGAAPVGALYRAFGLSLLPKYMPGRLLGPGLRARLAAAGGISYPVVVGSLVWEMGLGLAGATAITAVGIGGGIAREFEPAARWLALAVPALAAAGLLASVVPRVRSLLAIWLHPRVAWRQPMAVGALFLGYIGTWPLCAAAHWMLARSMGPFPGNQVVPLLVALAASWTLGALSFFAPAGLGVREGALFLFAKGPMGVPAALLFVTLSRLVIFAVEVLLTLAAWRLGPKRRPVGISLTNAPPP